MPCLSRIKIKSNNPLIQKVVYAPCGTCENCRKRQKMSWSFRCYQEFIYWMNQGYNVGFLTLTYREQSLPVLPYYCFQNLGFRKPRVPCFCKDDVKDLILSFRKYFHKKYKITNIRYLVSCEYGEETHRPHMHACFIIPPELDPMEFYNYVNNYWTNKFGFIIPRMEDALKGGFHGKYYNKPFLIVENPRKAANYVSKYICKDIEWQKIENDYNLIKNKYRKRYSPFHLQSKSFGACFLNGKDDRQKLDYLLNGVRVQGEMQNRPLPPYYRNKILYRIFYVHKIRQKEVIKRVKLSKHCVIFEKKNYILVRSPQRFITDLYYRYYCEIYNKSIESIENKVTEWKNFDYISKNCTKIFPKSKLVQKVLPRYSPADIARFYRTRYAVDFRLSFDIDDVLFDEFRALSKCFVSSFSLSWMNYLGYYNEAFQNCLNEFLDRFAVYLRELEKGGFVSYRKSLNFSAIVSHLFTQAHWIDEGVPKMTDGQKLKLQRFHKGIKV